MKNSITSRYDKNSNNELVINISAEKVEDLFEDYDKKSTFIKKDLKESLEKYLIESVEEIAEHPFIIKFYFDEIYSYLYTPSYFGIVMSSLFSISTTTPSLAISFK